MWERRKNLKQLLAVPDSAKWYTTAMSNKMGRLRDSLGAWELKDK